MALPVSLPIAENATLPNIYPVATQVWSTRAFKNLTWSGTVWQALNDGASAYISAVRAGYVGTEAQWVASLSAPVGPLTTQVNSLSTTVTNLTPPVPTNNEWILFGDSRMSSSTEDSSTPVANRLTSYGLASWIQDASNYRGKFVGNYGVNANNLTQMKDRLTVATTRGQVLSSTASVVVFICGVNETTSPLSATAPLYEYIINTLTAAGKIVIWLNELPNSNQSTQGLVNLKRRQYIDGIVYVPSTNKVVKVNSYDIAAQNPTSYYFRSGYILSTDLLHPDLVGNRAIGTAVGQVLDTLFARAGFAPRNILPTLVGDTGFGQAFMFSGTTGSVGTGATGVMSDGWSADAVPAGLTASYSKSTDSEGFEQQIVNISGTSGAAGGLVELGIYNYNAGGTFVVSGDTVAHGCRVVVDSGNVGFAGFGVGISAGDNTNSIYQNAAQFSGSLYNPIGLAAGAWGGASFDRNVLSQPLTLGSGWTASTSKSIIPSVVINVLGGQAVNVTLRLSRSGILVNK